jgi:hydroxymethylglutaryl-CoA lyase
VTGAPSLEDGPLAGLRATIVEVGPRDGLQSHSEEVPTNRKIAMIDRLFAAGLTEIEATSFAHPKMVPYLADGADVLRVLPRRSGVHYRALVPNHKGALRAIEAGADTIVAFVSASPAYSERNQNMTIEQALGELEQIAGAARDAGIGWVAGVSMAFGSPYEDDIPRDDVLALVERCATLRPAHLYVADTVGGAGPGEVRAMCTTIRERFPRLSLAVHLHGADARGLACAVAAVRAGAEQVETSICGLGGPVVRSPGSEPVGNLATEAVVATFAQLGIDTGLDPAVVATTARTIAGLLGLPDGAGERPVPAAEEVAALADA